MKVLITVLILIFLALQYRLWSGPGSFEEMNQLDKKITLQADANAILQERNANLIQEVDNLKTGMDSIEERARSELGLIKKGETFFLIIDEEEKK